MKKEYILRHKVYGAIKIIDDVKVAKKMIESGKWYEIHPVLPHGNY